MTCQRYLSIVICTIAWIFSRNACGVDTLPPLQKEDLPALIYHMSRERSLCLVTFRDGKVETRTILVGDYLRTIQLCDGVFLVTSGIDPKTEKTWLLDFNSAKKHTVSENDSLTLLRCDPQKSRALLASRDWKQRQAQLFELHWNTVRLIPGKVLPLKHGLAASADFRKLAYLEEKDEPAVSVGGTIFDLMLLDADTLKSEVLVPGIRVEISLLSSLFGSVPFAWLNENEILFQDMPLATVKTSHWERGTRVLKVANVLTRGVTEKLRCDLPLDLDGGDLSFNHLTSCAVYNSKWVVDLNAAKLTSVLQPFAIEEHWKKPRTSVILNGENALYAGGDKSFDGCLLSFTRRNFAYVLRPSSSAECDRYELYVKLDRHHDPLKVRATKGSELRPMGWIEQKP